MKISIDILNVDFYLAITRSINRDSFFQLNKREPWDFSLLGIIRIKLPYFYFHLSI